MLNRKKYIEGLVLGGEVLRRHKASLLSAEKDTSITPSQWQVIRHIYANEGGTTNEAAAALGMSGSAVTQLVNALVSKRYVKRERDPDDRRAHRLVLSSESKKRIQELRGKRVKLMLKLFAALSDKEFKQYVLLHQKILGSFAKNK